MKFLLAVLCLQPAPEPADPPPDHPCAAHLERESVSITRALLECQAAQAAETPPLPGPEARKVLDGYMAEGRGKDR